MSASIERSLYIGLLKTRFDLFDNVKLKLKNNKIVEGEIIDLDENVVTLENKRGNCYHVFVDDIENYISE